MRSKKMQTNIDKLSCLFLLLIFIFSACSSERKVVEGFEISFLEEESKYPQIALSIDVLDGVESLKKKELVLTENDEEVEVKTFRKKGNKYYLVYESLSKQNEIALKLQYESKNSYWGEAEIDISSISTIVEEKSTKKDDKKVNSDGEDKKTKEKSQVKANNVVKKDKKMRKLKEDIEETDQEEKNQKNTKPKHNEESQEEVVEKPKELTLEEKYANIPEKNLVGKNNVIDISASTVLPNMRRKSGEVINYAAINVLDRNIKTVWAEGNKNSLGAGEYIEVKFKESVISKIRIFNGYGETKNNLFYDNNRATKATITIGDYVESFILDPNLFDYQTLTLSKYVQGDRLRITFDEIYDENVDDLCISELEIIGFDVQ